MTYKTVLKLLLIAGLLLSLFFPVINISASQGIGTVVSDAPYVPGRVLVKFKQGAGLKERLQAHVDQDALVIDEMKALDIQVVQVRPGAMDEALARYRANPWVAYAEPDYLVTGAFTPNDTYYASLQWGPKKIQADRAWDITTGDPNIIVAVVDSGADFSHPDLQGKLIAGWDYVNNDADPSDDNGHGTFVAGIIGAATNNGQGIAGIGFNTKLLVVKVLDQYAVGSNYRVAQGIIYAADQGARVINLSLGTSAWSSTVLDAVEYAWNKGCLLVAAAGNNNSAAPYYPAAYEHVMGVSATDPNDVRWSLSNYGSYISVAAPGQGIYSTDWLGGAGPYSTGSGTSAAAPHVSGVAALLLAQDGSRTNTQLWSTIESTADDLGDAGWDQYYGYGRVNAYRALGGSSTPVPTPSPTLTPTPTPTPAVSSVVHIGDLDGVSSLSGKNWKATVTILVHDGNHNPVASATVSGSWSGGYSGSASCTTDNTGRCSVTTGAINSKKTSTTFVVDSVTGTGLTYQPTANHDLDGDSDGTQITVFKP